MAQVWSTFLRLSGGIAGEAAPKLEARASLGPMTRPGILEQRGESIAAFVGTLRVGFVGRTYDNSPPIRCDISTPDNGLLIASIDVPFVMSVELPVNIRVFPIVSLADGVLIELVGSAALEPINEHAFGATRTDAVVGAWVAGAANTVLLEPWCEAVTLHTPAATGSWLDETFAAIGTFSGASSPVVRPRQAVAVGPSAATLITQHFTS